MDFRILPALLFSGSLAASGFDAAPPTPKDEKFGFTGIAAPAPPATPHVTVPDLPYEAQVAASERLVTGFSTRLTYAEERRERPYLAYVELFEAWQEEHVKQNAANVTKPVAGSYPLARGQAPGDDLLHDALFVGGMTGFGATPGSAAAKNWVYASLAYSLITALIPDPKLDGARAAYKDAKEARERQFLPLTTPSIVFLRSAPVTNDDETRYLELKAATRFVVDLGLQCEPTVLHGGEGPAYTGTHFSNDTYNRKFVCGYGPGEKLGEKEAVAESNVLAVVSLNDKPAYVRYAMINLPTMPRLKQMLPGVPDDELARAVFTRVGKQLGTEWTAVFNAPNKDGDLAMYVAHAGALVELPPVKK